MKEITLTLKVEDDFQQGDCMNCRFSKYLNYSDRYQRVMYKCTLSDQENMS